MLTKSTGMAALWMAVGALKLMPAVKDACTAFSDSMPCDSRCSNHSCLITAKCNVMLASGLKITWPAAGMHTFKVCCQGFRKT